MVVLRNHFFVWLFCVFIQRNIQSCSANNNNCLNLKLNSSQKLNIQLYAQALHGHSLDEIVCPTLSKYSGKVTLEFKIGPLTKGNAPNLTCPGDRMCTANRYQLCMHQIGGIKGVMTQCPGAITADTVELAKCICSNEISNVLIQNAKDWATLRLSDDKLPTLILNGKWDPCLDVSSADAFEKYVHKIYN